MSNHSTIDRTRARDAFAAYVGSYDPANPRIALKIAHTYRVAELCDRIARAEGADPDLAWLCGLLHDIGRFEQVRRYDTFNDALSESHAALGVGVLFGDEGTGPEGRQQPLIRAFVLDDRHDEALRMAIATHSDYRVPQGLDPATHALCDVLRDADKIDIIKVNCICPVEDIYGVTAEEMSASRLSPAVRDIFYERRTIPRGVRKHPADILVGHICFAWELVYPTSRQILKEQGYLDRMLSRTFDDPATNEQFATMARYMKAMLA